MAVSSSQAPAASQSMIAERTGWWSADRSVETMPVAMTTVHDAGGIASSSGQVMASGSRCGRPVAPVGVPGPCTSYRWSGLAGLESVSAARNASRSPSLMAAIRVRTAGSSTSCPAIVSPRIGDGFHGAPWPGRPDRLLRRDDLGGLGPDDLPAIVAEPVAVGVPAGEAGTFVEADAGLVAEDGDG